MSNDTKLTPAEAFKFGGDAAISTQSKIDTGMAYATGPATTEASMSITLDLPAEETPAAAT